jgi:hypothetical protein
LTGEEKPESLHNESLPAYFRRLLNQTKEEEMMNKEQLQELVTRLRTKCRKAWRGAFWWDEERRVAVVFGNDGLPSAFHSDPTSDPDERVDFEIAAVRELLRRYGGKELAFAVKSISSWAMACDLSGSSLQPDVLEKKMWTTWNNNTAYDPEIEEIYLPARLRWLALSWRRTDYFDHGVAS